MEGLIREYLVRQRELIDEYIGKLDKLNGPGLVQVPKAELPPLHLDPVLAQPYVRRVETVPKPAEPEFNVSAEQKPITHINPAFDSKFRVYFSDGTKKVHTKSEIAKLIQNAKDLGHTLPREASVILGDFKFEDRPERSWESLEKQL